MIQQHSHSIIMCTFVFAHLCDMEGKYGPHNFIIQSRDSLLALSLVEQISSCGFRGLG